MDSKTINITHSPVLVVKKDVEFGMRPFEVELIFIIEGVYGAISERFETEKERDVYFDSLDNNKTLEIVEDYIDFYN